MKFGTHKVEVIDQLQAEFHFFKLRWLEILSMESE